jgi:phosphotriesterase-related protein
MLAAGALVTPQSLQSAGGNIISVRGPVPDTNTGFILAHEHIIVDFIGADLVSTSRYKREEVFRTALPRLMSVKQLGCKTIIDCTPAYLGRDVTLLKQLSDASGLHLVTNTGYYGAVGEKYFPGHVYTESAEQIAARWIREWKEGIEGTGIKPGFIKTGVDKFPLTRTQEKVVEAAAITNLATGLTICIHTGDGKAAMQEMEILTREGVKMSSWVWVHAQNEANSEYHIKAAQAGGWVSFDGVNPASKQKHAEMIAVMKSRQLLDHVLVSQDSGWYHVGEENGGSFRDYNFILTDFIPMLRTMHFTKAEIDMLFIVNPARAFSIKQSAL